MTRFAWVVLIAAIAVTTVAFRSELRPLRSSATEILVDEDFDDFGTHVRSLGTVDGSPGFSGVGVTLKPGLDADFRIPFTVGPERTPALKIWLYSAEGVQNSIECSTDGRRFVSVRQNVFTSGGVVPLRQCRGSPIVVARIHVRRAASAAAGEALVIDKVQMLGLSRPPSAPGLDVLSAAWFLLAVALIGASSLGASRRPLVLIAVAAVAFLAVAHAEAPTAFRIVPQLRASPVALLGGLLLLAWSTKQWNVSPPGRRLEVLAVILLVVVGFSARWATLVRLLDDPLRPDALSVSVMAGQMRGMYDTGVREPLWVWLVRGLQWVSDDRIVASRMFSLSASVLLLVATHLFARIYLGKVIPALGVLALLAVHTNLIESSADAHRTELYALCLVLVAAATLAPQVTATRRMVGLATGSVLTGLTQTAGLIPVWLAAIWAWLARRVSAAAVVLAVCAATVALVPHALHTHRTYGQALYFTRTLVPVFYRNYEFVVKRGTGCDGCPTRQEMALSSYSGQRLSMFDYLFRLHSTGEVLRRMGGGYLSLLIPGPELEYVLGSRRVAIYVLYLVGFVVALGSRARELLLIPLASVNLLAFVIPLGIDLRLLLHIAPFAVIVVVLGFSAAAMLLARFIRRPSITEWLEVQRISWKL